MKRLITLIRISVATIIATAILSGCAVVNAISNPCVENKADGTRICTIDDSNQNVTTRTIERDHKIFVSTCSNGYCTEFKEINAAKDKLPESQP